MATHVRLVFHESSCAAHHPVTFLAVRPSIWSSNPPAPPASLIPVCHQSCVILHRACATPPEPGSGHNAHHVEGDHRILTCSGGHPTQIRHQRRLASTVNADQCGDTFRELKETPFKAIRTLK